MPLATTADQLFSGFQASPLADSGAVGAFSVHDLGFIRAVLDAATEADLPVILAVGQASIAYAGLETLASAALRAAEAAPVPVMVLLNHARDLNQIRAGLDVGVGMVMLDATHLPHAENIRLTREAVRLAHEYGALCEGELAVAVDDAQADGVRIPAAGMAAYAEATGVDFLAVSLGELHGLGDLSQPRAKDILQRLCDLPVLPALHKGSAQERHLLSWAVQRGVRKVNVNAALKKAWAAALSRDMAIPGSDGLGAMTSGRLAVQEEAARIMRLLAGKE